MFLKMAERKRVKKKRKFSEENQSQLQPACIPIQFLELHNFFFFMNLIINACLYVYLRCIHGYIKGESIECVKKGTFCMQFNFLNGRVREGQPGQWSGNSIPVPSQIEAARSRHGITNCRDQKKNFVVTQHFSGIGTHSASVISKGPREKRNSSFKLIYFDI